MSQGRCKGKNVATSPGSSVTMFHANSARMCLARNAKMSPDSNASRCLGSSASLFQSRFARMSQDNSARTSPVRSATRLDTVVERTEHRAHPHVLQNLGKADTTILILHFSEILCFTISYHNLAQSYISPPS